MIELEDKSSQLGTTIKIIGVGGAGGNAVNTMIQNELYGVEFIAANTDASDLQKSRAKMKLQLGRKLTRGLGTGANPEIGARSAEESKDEIKAHLEGADMVFIAAGMGGGTGTGAAPVIAKHAREMGILTLGIVTTPFPFEGAKRKSNAEMGIANLSEYVDTLIMIPNAKLCEIYGDMTLIEAFHKADNVLYEAAKAVSDIINVNGFVNADFADVKTVMQNMGFTLMGTGTAEGENRAVNAAKCAINNPLLTDISLQGCQSLLINIIAGPDIIMSEFEEVSSVVVNETGQAANIIMGVIIDEAMVGKVSVTIIATGLKRTDNVERFEFPAIPETLMEKRSVPKPHTTHQTKKDDDIDDIFTRLNINQPQNKEDRQAPKDEEPARPLNPRTDLPSFLKALD
jgi:cell division protein FtsZ